jgi:hypothetical protein
MSGIPKIPKRLLESREEILRGFGSKPATNYDAGPWRKHFEGDSDFQQISQEFPTSIRRIDVEGLSRQVRNGSYTQIRKLFLASMIWGYVKDDLRGAWRTKQMLSHGGAREMLEKAARWIGNGQIVEACEGFRLPWCGSVFSTKFFYFIGLGAGTSLLPCILDSKVAQSLGQLGKDEGWNLPPFDNVYGKGIRRCPEGYIQYIRALDEWARELGCRADYIEYFLYSLAKGSSETRKVHKEESMGKWLPLRKAYEFGKAKGFETDIEGIRSLKEPKRWKDREVGIFSRVRRWKVKELFEHKRIWDEFKHLHWPEGGQRNGQPNLALCKKAAGVYDILTKVVPVVGAGSMEKDSIRVPLPEDEMEKLKEKAQKFGVDASTLARIWILERLS